MALDTITDVCELRSPGRAVSVLNHWIISPAPGSFFLRKWVRKVIEVVGMNTCYSTCFQGISYHHLWMKGHQNFTWDRWPSWPTAVTNNTQNLPFLPKVSYNYDWSLLLESQNFHFSQGYQNPSILRATPTYIWASNIMLQSWALDHFPPTMVSRKLYFT